jgi:hypothetical protein
VLIPADLGDLSRDARAVALGRVVEVDARWADDRRSIDTLVTLDVDAYLKGSLGSPLQFRVPGGRLGRYRSILVGAPEFAINQRIVVFLGARGPSVPYVLGLSQGVVRPVAATDGSMAHVPPVLPAAAGPALVVQATPHGTPCHRRLRAYGRSPEPIDTGREGLRTTLPNRLSHHVAAARRVVRFRARRRRLRI